MVWWKEKKVFKDKILWENINILVFIYNVIMYG